MALFKTRSYYVFDYKPRFYDERKERIQDLEKKYSAENSDKEISKIHLTKNNLKNDWIKSKSKGRDSATMKRLAIIITILVGLATYIFDLHRLF